jgi:hypothetical protein
LAIDADNDKYCFELNPSYDGPDLPWFLLNPNGPLTLSQKIKMWIASRVPEPEYEFIDTLLQRIGAREYDPYAFFKYNHGKYISDNYWCEKVEEISNEPFISKA